MADLDLQSLGMRLGEAITPTPSNAPQVRYATVAAVNADGTLDVTIDGTTLRGVCATTGCVGAAEGMRCVVLRQGPLATVVGLIAGYDLGNIVLPNRKAIFGTDSNGVPLYVFEPRNVNDNAAINFHGYADANSSTEIYGNEIYLKSRDKRLQLEGGNCLNDAESGNATLNATYLSAGTITLKKINGIVYCTWDGLAMKSSAGRTNVATIPEAFRPTNTVYAPHTTIAAEEYVLVFPSGAFTLNKTTSGSRRWGSACWIAANDFNAAG